MNTSQNLTNITISYGSSAPWIWIHSVTLITSITGSFSNILILVQIIRKRLKSPFMVYVTVLAVTNAVISVIYQPFLIVIDFWDNRNAAVCDISMYFNGVFAGILFYVHLLATANRLWAILMPVSYKNHHTVKLSLMLSFSAVVVVHVGCLPFYIINIGNYIHTKNGVLCQYPSRVYRSDLAIFPEVIFYIVPTFVMIVTYPLMAVVISCRQAAGHRRKNNNAIAILLLMTVTMLFSFGLEKVIVVLSIAGVKRNFEVPGMIGAVASLSQPTLDAVIFIVCLKDLQVGVACKGRNRILQESSVIPMASRDETHRT